MAASLVPHIYSLSWFSLLVPLSFFLLLCASAASPVNMCEVCLVYLRVGRTGIREIPSLAQHSHAGALQNCRLWSLPQTACLSACLPKCGLDVQARGGEAEGESEGESQADSRPCREPDVGLHLMTLRCPELTSRAPHPTDKPLRHPSMFLSTMFKF